MNWRNKIHMLTLLKVWFIIGCICGSIIMSNSPHINKLSLMSQVIFVPIVTLIFVIPAGPMNIPWALSIIKYKTDIYYQKLKETNK